MADFNNYCLSSRWLTEEVLKLIDIVHHDEAIYNPRHKYYFCRPYVENFWREVDQKLEKSPGSSLAKWTNLRISFRRELTNYLEEKISPCWSYFDRMLFLYPYLRKKSQHGNFVDNQMLAITGHVSNLSNSMNHPGKVSTGASENDVPEKINNSIVHSPQKHLANYLDYFEDQEHNISEYGEIIDEDQSRFQKTCTDNVKLESLDNFDECKDKESITTLSIDINNDEINNDMRNLDQYSTTPLSLTPFLKMPQEVQNKECGDSYSPRSRILAFTRLKRSSSRDALIEKAVGNNVKNATFQNQTNISLVRPTISKAVDITSTSPNCLLKNFGVNRDLAAFSSTATSTSQHFPYNQYKKHIETKHTTGINTSGAKSATQGGHVELCDCKTDPDALFLMSLLPDIQKLNGRDRGKIKIAYQNILQDFLYPD